MSPSKDRLDVVDAVLIEGVQQIDLDREWSMMVRQIHSCREVADRPGLDSVRVKRTAAVHIDK